MYKLVVNSNGYTFYKQYKGNHYQFVGNFKNQNALVKGIDMRPGEIEEALRFMSDTNHNVAEFGYNRYFTVSYFTNNHNEFLEDS